MILSSHPFVYSSNRLAQHCTALTVPLAAQLLTVIRLPGQELSFQGKCSSQLPFLPPLNYLS